MGPLEVSWPLQIRQCCRQEEQLAPVLPGDRDIGSFGQHAGGSGLCSWALEPEVDLLDLGVALLRSQDEELDYFVLPQKVRRPWGGRRRWIPVIGRTYLNAQLRGRPSQVPLDLLFGEAGLSIPGMAYAEIHV